MEVEKLDKIKGKGLIIVEARLRDRSKIEKAIAIQDKLRVKSKKWEGRCKRDQKMARFEMIILNASVVVK